MDLITRLYFAMEIQERERAISRKQECTIARIRRILLLICCNGSSLVIDKLCDEAVKGDPAVVCFYFDMLLWVSSHQ